MHITLVLVNFSQSTRQCAHRIRPRHEEEVTQTETVKVVHHKSSPTVFTTSTGQNG